MQVNRAWEMDTTLHRTRICFRFSYKAWLLVETLNPDNGHLSPQFCSEILKTTAMPCKLKVSSSFL